MTLPDTGSRSQFETGAVRDACAGKGLPSRIPPEAIRRLAKRYEDGEAKYPDADGVPNWMRGIPLSRYYDSAMRHLMAAAEGDTSEDHLGAVLWNAAGWIWTADAIADGRLPVSLDDLPFARTISEDWEHEHDPGLTLPDQTGGTEWWDPKHDSAKICFSDGREFDAPPLPKGYDSYRVVPYGEGPGPNGPGFFWYEGGEPCTLGWQTHSHYRPGDRSDFYWIVAERTVKPGDRVRVTDTDGPGEPYEFDSFVTHVDSDGKIAVTHTPHWYRRDQVTVLP